ncbi:MAG: nuclease-related domain-containing protein [Actinomycetota bacterium]|nr:nuclease-related domain-containing protein [Actinomycetota bacterium]
MQDLAETRAGAAVRSRAIAEQQAHPVATFLARLAGAHTDERAWRMGEKGEVLVARELARLGAGWHYLNAVPIGTKGADVDHVVIGPPGVFSMKRGRVSRA